MQRRGTAFLIATSLALACSVAGPSPPEAPAEPSVDESEATKPDREPVLLRWSTASEFENFGFNVYRGPTPEGPFVCLTEESIPGAGTSTEPHHYAFEDSSAVAGESYYYYVELISTSGKTRRLMAPQLFQN